MKEDSNSFYSHFEQSFTTWALGINDIRAVFMIGSRARSNHPADIWSDMDMVIYARNPEQYLMDSDWVQSLGNVISSFVFKTAGNDPERLTLFEGGWQVDFVIHSFKDLTNMASAKTIPDNFYRGVKVILDKDNLSKDILPKEFAAPEHAPLTEAQFSTNIEMFWFTAMYIAKQILRNELWVVKERDHDLKTLLLQMIEWHEKILHGADYDTWHAGRFISEWVSPATYKELLKTFGHFDKIDSWNALLASISLYKTLSHEISKRADITYKQEFEDYVYSWINSHSDSIIAAAPNN